MRAPVPFLSLLFVVGLALSGVACGSASIKPGGVGRSIDGSSRYQSR